MAKAKDLFIFTTHMKATKYILIFVLFIFLLFGGYYFLNYNPQQVKTKLDLASYEPNSSYQAQFEERDVAFASKAIRYENANGDILFSFTESSVPNDATKLSFYPMTTLSSTGKWTIANREKNRERIKSLWDTYGSIIQEASEVHRIPSNIILGILSVEHDDSVSVKQAAASSSGTYLGLGQIALKTAKDSVLRYPTIGWITKSQLKPFLDKGLIKNNEIILTKKDLLKPDVNIHAVGATLSGLAFKFGFINTYRWIFAYNRGEGRMLNDGTQDLKMDELVKYYRKIPAHAVGANYITNILGPNGSVDIIFNDLKIES